MFNYQSGLEWLRKEAGRLTADGYTAELRENSEQLPSVVFKISNDAVEAELVVWENGRTSAMVYDLAKDRYALDRHDLVLSERFAQELRLFFDLLPQLK